MFDTLKVSFQYWLERSFLERLKGYSCKDDFETFWDSIYSPDGKRIGFTYYPQDPIGRPIPHLSFEFSAPKLIFNCNHHLLSNVDLVIEKANSIIHQIPQFSPLKIEEGKISRIDYCCQYDCFDRVQDYVEALRSADYPRRTTDPFKYRGVYFNSGVSAAVFYAKYLECGHPEVKHTLRHESRILETRRLENLLGIKSPTILDINLDFAIRTLEKDLERLRLKDNIICNRDTAAENLLKKHGKTRGRNLYLFWQLKQSYTRDQLKTVWGYSPESINSKERLIKDAGIATISSKEILPPLKVNL